MHSITGFLDIIILIGAIQGLIFSCLLYKNKDRQPANRLLSALIFLIALASFKLYGTNTGWFNSTLGGWLDALVPMIVIMPLGPLIYFYVRATLDPDFRLTRKDRKQFYPILIDLIPQFAAIIYIVGVITRTLLKKPAPWVQFIDTYNVYADLPRWCSVTFYVWMSARLLTAHSPRLPKEHFNWLRQFIKYFQIFQIIWLIYLIPYLIPAYTDKILDWVDWYPIYVPLAVLVYWMGVKGYIVSRQPAMPLPKKPLPEAQLETSVPLLLAAMEKDKLYLNPDLNLSIFATHTGLTAKHISAVLNQHMQRSFNEFVNEYRVQVMKARLLDGQADRHTIAGMAYECGFNSLATFQRAFKSSLGQTPSEFLRHVKDQTLLKSGFE